MTKHKHYHLTFTGIYGDLRRCGKETLKRFNVPYSGSLVSGETTHLICDPATLSTLLSAMAPSDKLRLAVEEGIPIVSYQWLDDSAAAGRMLLPAQYLLDLESSLPALTEVSCTAGNGYMSPIERLRAASVNNNSEVNAGCFAVDSMLSPGLSLLAEAAEEKASVPARSNDVSKGDACSFEELPSPEGFENNQQQSSMVEISFGSGGNGGFGSPDGAGGSHGLPAIPEEDQEAAEIASAWDADQCYANIIAADFSDLNIAKPRSKSRVQRSSLSRYAPWGAAQLPLSIVLAGQASAKKPSSKTLAGIKQIHGSRTPFFFSSLLAKTGHAPKVQEIAFKAGDLSHGAKIIYDTDTQTGQQIFAHVVIKTIYALAGSPDSLWMEHHYMFTSDDMMDRPSWGRALENEEPIEDEELLLSANVYHSPAHLIVGDLGVQMRSSWVKEKQKAVADEEVKKYFPLLSCSRAFDVAEKRIIPLSKALQDY
ncbi:hypothetical protein NADE_000886 [Nannochloris sp. 'desiccata']|nr:hypothetical protein NADE_000886 [Chlorella desiccata (nom. nud.)]